MEYTQQNTHESSYDHYHLTGHQLGCWAALEDV